MGLMDSLKKATGLGLKPSEYYDRAWEKGVLLGQEKYADAASLFETAYRKAVEAQDLVVAQRARANSALYSWLSSGSLERMKELRAAMEGLDEIEVIGSRSEALPADQLRVELDGRLLEQEIMSMPSDAHHHRESLHRKASDVFKRIFTQNLVTYRYHSTDAHVERAQSRFFLHQGYQGWHGALALIDSDTDGAAEHAARAVASFRQCQDETWFKKAEGLLGQLRARRTCWMCHRELAGLGYHVTAYPAVVSAYVATAVAKLGHDLSSIDATNGNIVLCTPCGSAVEFQAQKYATEKAEELRREVGDAVATLRQAVATLEGEIRSLNARMLLR